MSKNLQKTLESRAAAHREDLAREKRNYGTIRPREAQVAGRRTWKSDSKARFASKAFRDGFGHIDWTSTGVASGIL